jgi:3D (Asp-Asp-Asp) domain-containing protein
VILRYPLSLATALSVGLVVGAGLGRERVEAEPLVNLSTGDQSFTILHWDGGAAWMGHAPGQRDDGVTTVCATKPPQEQVSNPAAAVPSPRRVWIKTTAYCPGECCCEGSADGITATGARVARKPYGGASAWDKLSRGTRFRVPGYDPGRTGGWYEVDDSGGDMRKAAESGVTHLDLRFRTHYWAKKWGTRWLWVEVMR